MKRGILCGTLSAALLLAGCGTAAPEDSGQLKIVATIAPEYDWTMHILGENPAGAEVTLLLDSGADLHSYQPTAADIMKISDCDVFICVGGESDRWVDDALKEASNPDMTVIRLLEAESAGALEEEVPEGAAAEAEDDAGYDEHIWLSLRRAAALTGVIAEALEEKDPANRDVYARSAEKYIAQLQELDEE